MEASALAALIRSEASKTLGVDAEWKVSGPVFSRQYSKIYRAQCSAFSFPLAVKLCLQLPSSAADGAEAKRQFFSLREVRSKLPPDRRFRVPEPVVLLEGRGVFAAEWVAATSLTEQFSRWRCSASDLLRSTDDAAEWLRRFHFSFRGPQVHLNCEELVAQLLEGNSPAIAQGTYVQSCRRLRDTSNLVTSVPLDSSQLHGDFKSDNLLINAENVAAIDIQLKHRNTVLFDLASFLNHMELLAMNPKGMRIALLRRQLADRFVAVYFGRSPDKPLQLALRWTRLFSALGAWSNFAEIGDRGGASWYMNRCYQRLTHRLGRELSLVSIAA